MKLPRLRTQFASHYLGKVKYSETAAVKAAEHLKKKGGHLKDGDADSAEMAQPA